MLCARSAAVRGPCSGHGGRRNRRSGARLILRPIATSPRRRRRLRQRWSQDDFAADQPGYCLACLDPADLGEGIEGGRLFGHNLLNTKAGKAPTQRLEARDRRWQPAPSDFGGPSDDVADAGSRGCGDQAVIIEQVPLGHTPRLALGNGWFHGGWAPTKEVKLLGEHSLTGS
jgi:hypothetical protein